MTLLPCEPVRITVPPQDAWPWEGLPGTCQVPECGERGEPGSHHIVRRSHTGGPVRFVSIDGLVLVNEIRLCLWHHGDVTDHRAWVVYEGGNAFNWYRRVKRGEESQIGDRTIVQAKSGDLFIRVGRIK